ncbi:MAG: DNA internalization-related competence protein ComEC/Rec2 [Candidatus Solibacter usitatus]|nr:DNA internalization-related competence protein ComEC/Rec2 [Candidatus Solibacter usitatus]
MAVIATGILVSRFVPFETRELLAVLAAFFVLGLLSLWRDARVLAAVCALLGLTAAGALLRVAHPLAAAPDLGIDGRELVRFTGCVVEPSALSEGRDQFTLEIDRGARVRVSLWLGEGEAPPSLRYGQRITVDARLRHPHNFGNPGSFDYVRYLARQRIYWTASASSGTRVEILPGECCSKFMRAIFALRTAALDRLETLYAGKPYQTGMMQAVLIGETAKLQKIWTTEYRATGTFHALVISGAHVAVLAAVFLFLLRLCFVPSGAALCLTTLAAWVYAVVTGWQAPVVRSAAGFTLFTLGRFLYRRGQLMNLLAAVAIGFLVFDPEQMFEASFQLSFLSVAFLAAFAVPWIERSTGPMARALSDLTDAARDPRFTMRAAQFRVEMRLLAETVSLATKLPERWAGFAIAAPARTVFFFHDLIVTSAVIQFGLAPLMALYFHRVSFSGLSANAFVVPLLGMVVPVGFVAIFTGSTWAAALAGWLLALSQRAVAWHAHWEPNWRIPTPPVWLPAAFAAALILTAFLPRGWRRAKMASLVGAVVFFSLLVWHPFAPALAPGWLEMTVIDVGQGDSILLAFPDGKLMLVDAGGIPSFGKRPKTGLDIGEDVVSPYLWNRSIRTLDVVALSHAHDDHMGGLRAVCENFHVRELWTGATPDSPEWTQLRDLEAARGVKIVPLQQGRRFVYGGVNVEILAPLAEYVPAAAPRNNDSLVFRLDYGRRSFILSGDVERPIERAMAAGNLIQPADVLKIAHHGSKSSTSEAFLDLVHPAFAVISAGFENSYGHPHADVLGRLAEHRTATYRTDKMGLITIRTDGQHIEVIAPDSSHP